MATYDKAILRVLAEAGEEGLSVQKISRHVHNACNTFFDVLSYDDVHAYVRQFLQKNSRNPQSLIERTHTRGTYRINLNSQETRQLMLRFVDDAEEAVAPSPAGDSPLPLFPE